MRSFTALTLLLALIGVLQTNAGGAFNLEGKGKGSRRLKSDPNVADGGGNKNSVDAQSVECGAGSTKGPKDSRKLKKSGLRRNSNRTNSRASSTHYNAFWV